MRTPIGPAPRPEDLCVRFVIFASSETSQRCPDCHRLAFTNRKVPDLEPQRSGSLRSTWHVFATDFHMPLLYRCCTVAALRHHAAPRGRDSYSDLAPEQGFEP